MEITKLDIELDWQLEQKIIERGTVSRLTARREKLTIAPDLLSVRSEQSFNPF